VDAGHSPEEGEVRKGAQFQKEGEFSKEAAFLARWEELDSMAPAERS